MLISFEQFGFNSDYAIESSCIKSVSFKIRSDLKGGRITIQYAEGQYVIDLVSPIILDDRIEAVYMKVRQFINVIKNDSNYLGEEEIVVKAEAISTGEILTNS